MAEENKAQEKRKISPIVIVFGVVVILLIFALIFVIIWKSPSESEQPSVTNAADVHMINGVLQYDERAVVLDEDDLQKRAEELNQQVQDGYIRIAHKNKMVSNDGENFQCYIQNNVQNKYDVIINIYKDSNGEEQMLLTGLIPPGTGIGNFKSEIKLDPGIYEALVVITQVEDDHQTLRNSQLRLLVDMFVGDNYTM